MGSVLLLESCSPRARLGPTSESQTSLDPASIARAEAAIKDSIAAGEIPGAVLLIGNADRVLYRKVFGYRDIRTRELMTEDTIFDLASLTKPVATATSIMKLIERGRLRAGDHVAAHIPEFAAGGKQDITVEQLLLHTSGLVADNSLDDYAAGPSEALRRIYALSPEAPPGARFQYSDVGYIILGELVRVIDGRPLDRFTTQEIFTPLGMKDTTFNPPKDWCNRIAPTEQREGRWLRGEVHDPRAARLGGVAGHAGVFATGDDLARFCQMILKEGSLDRRSILSHDSTRVMRMPVPCFRSTHEPQIYRTYGLDVESPYSSARGLRFPIGTVGHTGFTGTMFWIDPTHDLFVILLTSRLQMPGGGANKQIRAIVATYAAEAALGVDDTRVLTGIDALVLDDFKPLQGRRVGLITNQTGVDRFGRRTIDLLHRAPGVSLVAIFSPEHGIAGKLDREGIAHAKDDKTGLPIHSLYGETRRPTADMLAGVDTLVFDIQDIGTRFYTYITTLGYAMEEAAKHGKRFVVVDRPNPILPLGPRGPLADPDKLSFTAYKPLPVMHGMTLGELARLFQGEYLPELDLHVVEMEHYRRAMWWDDTGVEWVNPSPNMPSPAAALLYPGVGLLEMTNLSVGRGTDAPFEQIAAPWIDPRELADALDRSQLPGLRFAPTRFTPKASVFAGEPCRGVRITIVARDAVDPVRTGLTIAWHLRRLHGEAFESDKVLRLLANDAAHRAWQAAADPLELAAGELETPVAFLKMRRKYLIYD